jgi:hypothetical protein
MDEIKALESWDDVPVATQAEIVQEHTDAVNEEIVEEIKEEATVAENATVEETKEEVKEEIKEEPETVEKQPELIKVKVSGEEKEVTLEELKSNYSGKVAYDKKFSELDKERKAFIRERDQINKYVNEFRNISAQKGEVAAVSYLAEITGKAPHEFMDNLIKSLMPEIERRYSLTDEQLKLEKQATHNKYNQERLELERQQLKQQEAEKALQAEIEDVIASTKISHDEWEATVQELDAKLPKNQDMTPQIVKEYIEFKRDLRAEKHLGIFNGGQMANNAAVKAELVKVINDMPDLTDTEIQDLLTNAFKVKQTQELQEEISKKSSKKQQVKQQVQYKALESWDDI